MGVREIRTAAIFLLATINYALAGIAYANASEDVPVGISIWFFLSFLAFMAVAFWGSTEVAKAMPSNDRKGDKR